jgi:DNA-directed RNA polymerase specialized sigma24 family protein
MDEVETCERLMHAGQTRDLQLAFAMFEILRPSLLSTFLRTKLIRELACSLEFVVEPSDRRLLPEDFRAVFSEVVDRFRIAIDKKPQFDPPPTPPRPRKTVFSWCLCTARNWLLSEWRKKQNTETDHEGSEHEHARYGASEDRQSIFEARRLHGRLRRMLSACFPDGVAIFDASLEADVTPDDALAARLTIRVGNLHQRRTRMRLHCRALLALIDHEGVSDEEIAQQAGVVLTDINRKYVMNVRHYLAQRGGQP